MLKCRHIAENASEYLDGDLNSWQRVKIKIHLFICVDCRRYAKQLAQTVALLKVAVTNKAQPEIEHKVCQHYADVMTQHNTIAKK